MIMMHKQGFISIKVRAQRPYESTIYIEKKARKVSGVKAAKKWGNALRMDNSWTSTSRKVM